MKGNRIERTKHAPEVVQKFSLRTLASEGLNFKTIVTKRRLRLTDTTWTHLNDLPRRGTLRYSGVNAAKRAEWRENLQPPVPTPPRMDKRRGRKRLKR